MIAKMAVAPFLVKLASEGAIEAFDLTDNYLRQGLVLMPYYFLEGIMLAILIRFALSEDQNRPAAMPKLTGFQAYFVDRSRFITASTIVYMMLMLLKHLLEGFLQQVQTYQAERADQAPEPSVMMFFLTILMIGVLIWSFRLVWIYIPVAMEKSIAEYLSRIRGFLSSFYLLGTWFICVLPVVFFASLMLDVILQISGDDRENLTTATRVIASIWEALVWIAVSVISTIGIAFGIKSVFENKQEKE